MVNDNSSSSSIAASVNVCDNYVGWYRAFITMPVSILGLVGNMLVIIVTVTDSHKRCRFGIYMISLSFSHIVILLFNSILDDFLGRGLCYAMGTERVLKLDIISDASCKLMEYIPNVMYAWSSWTLVLFSIDRLITILRPIRYLSTNYLTTCRTLCVGVIGFAFVVHIPQLLAYQLVLDPHSGLRTSHKKCDLPRHSGQLGAMFLYCKIVGSFIMPTLMILTLDVGICAVLFRLLRRREQLLPSDEHKTHQEMRRVVGHLALTGVFLLFNVPLVIIMIMRLHVTLTGKRHFSQEYVYLLEDLSRLFSSVKDVTYAADFLLYFTFLSTFRSRTVGMLCGLCYSNDRSQKSEKWPDEKIYKCVQWPKRESCRTASCCCYGGFAERDNEKADLESALENQPDQSR